MCELTFDSTRTLVFAFISRRSKGTKSGKRKRGLQPQWRLGRLSTGTATRGLNQQWRNNRAMKRRRIQSSRSRKRPRLRQASLEGAFGRSEATLLKRTNWSRLWKRDRRLGNQARVGRCSLGRSSSHTVASKRIGSMTGHLIQLYRGRRHLRRC